MHMVEGLDTGDMILAREVVLDKKETAGTLHDKLAELGGKAVLEALDLIAVGRAPRIKQDDSQSSYVSVMDKTFGLIDFTKPAVLIERLIRGLNPWPTAYTYYNGKMFKIWDADVVESKGYNTKNVKAGTIVDVTKNEIVVLCGKDCLKLNSVQLEGKRRMTVSEFLRGYPVSAGTGFCNQK